MAGKAKFQMGRLMLTAGVAARFYTDGEFSTAVWQALVRHLKGDWGDLDPVDKQANEDALQAGARLFSAYKIGTDKIWIITEADRSSTTVLSPDEY